jgi:hypothetical protein
MLAMRRSCSWILLVLVALGCDREKPLEPAADFGVSPGLIPIAPSNTNVGRCPASDVIVASWGELVDAVAAATPGTTIGIAGTIALGNDVNINTTGLTITCATPGAGLTVADGATVNWLLGPRAPDVTITGLVLDATATRLGGAVFAFWDGVIAFGERVRVVNNTLRCGLRECIVLLGRLEEFAVVSGGTVADNRLEGPATDQFTFGIHVQGFRDVVVERNEVTTPTPGAGSGIAVNLSRDVLVRDNVVTGPWANNVWLFDNAVATRVVGNRLRGATEQAILAEHSDAVEATGNHAECGTACVLFHASPNAAVSGNLFQATEPGSGIHFQQGTDGTRILNNRITTAQPSTSPFLGGIRVRDGSGVLVAGNTVEGPWANGVATTELTNVTIERNMILGPSGFGLLLAMDGSTIASNRVSHGGGGGLRLHFGCFNVFTGNVLVGNDPGAVFDESTGANTYRGDPAPVTDLGNIDCDGDGVVDPNQIVARGRPVSAAALPAAPAGTVGVPTIGLRLR